MKNTMDVLASFSEIDITPEKVERCELIGFNRKDSTARGILHPLKAQVLLLQTRPRSYCLIAIDSIGFSTVLTNLLRGRISEQLNTKKENIMVCFSHTHSAPDAAANKAEYFEFIQQKIIKAVGVAQSNTFPIKAAWGVAENTIGINRRKDAASIDKRLGILKINDAVTNVTKLILLRITAHANVLTSDNYYISADYIGLTRDLLEKEYNCKVIVTQGASGNVKSKYRQKNADFLEEHPLEAAEVAVNAQTKKSDFDESMKSLSKNASEIFKAVNAVMDKIDPADIYRLSMDSETLTFFADVPTKKRAMEIVNEAASAGIDGKDWLEEVERLIEIGIKTQEAKKELQFLCVNNGCLCGVADEPMCEIAIDIQEKVGNSYVFFGGYTNGYEGYLPTADEYHKGGYEVLWSNLVYYKYYNRVMPLNSDTSHDLINIVAEKWKSIAEQTE
jgi:hypothetical protein